MLPRVPVEGLRIASTVGLLMFLAASFVGESTSAAGGETGAVREISATKPRRIALVVLRPSRKLATTSPEVVESLVADRLAAKARLELSTIAEAAVAPCRGALGCMVRTTPADAAWLLVLSFRDHGPNEDGVTALVLDVADARAALGDDDDETETRIFERAVRASPPPTAVRDRDELERLLDHLLFSEMRLPFEAAGDLGGLGAIDVEIPSPETRLVLDGQALAPLSPGPARITHVPSGRRRLEWHVGDRTIAAEELDVRSGETIVAERLPSADERSGRSRRDAFLWGGGAAIAAGSALVVVAALMPSPSWGVCASPSADAVDACSTSRFVRTSGQSTGGVMIAPLGVSVAILGAGAVTGAVIDDGDSAWAGLVVGFVAGIAAYVVAGIAEPAPHF